MIRAAGAREVHLRDLLAADDRPVPLRHRHADARGADRAPATRVEEIRAILGADSLGYLTLEGLRRCGARLKHGFCDACFSDEYPVPPAEEGPPPQLSLFRPVDPDDA